MTGSKNPLAAIVLCAGKGTRMRSRQAKVLHPICGRPLGFYPLRRAVEAGASPIAVVVGHQADAVQQGLAAWFPDQTLRFAVQTEQLGTAHAVLAAKEALRGHTGPVLILSGDTPLLAPETLARVAAGRSAGAPLAFATMRLADPTGYGRVVRDGAGRPARVVEQKDASPEERALDEVNAGLYCVEAGFLWEALSQVGSSNAQREFYLTDLVAMAARAGGAEAVPVSDVEAAGVNDREDLARAGRLLTRRAASALMRAGVTIEDPDRFDVDEGVEVGEETVIEPNVRLLGRTRVGPGCRLGAGSVLRDTVVGEGVTVNPYTVTDDARLERGAIVGPFSRLRPGADIGEEAHVGNFVEVKKTRLGKGSKANHLAYLGDARIGERVNVGAGTITCNYDGERKNPTVIGDGAFIGSDSILVAPIEIGAGAYVAAGSTLTDAVPPGALALGRARQSNKEGWAEKRQAAKGEKK
jgi:bifunctional UDP-N-acetylglucosamine pyrophosphorylase/glucosamine-1-phosphate N-acetyltransferase